MARSILILLYVPNKKESEQLYTIANAQAKRHSGDAAQKLQRCISPTVEELSNTTNTFVYYSVPLNFPRGLCAPNEV